MSACIGDWFRKVVRQIGRTRRGLVVVINGRGAGVELNEEDKTSPELGEVVLDSFDGEGGRAVNLSSFRFNEDEFHKRHNLFHERGIRKSRDSVHICEPGFCAEFLGHSRFRARALLFPLSLVLV